MASLGHWGMFPIDFAPRETELRWRADLGGFVIVLPISRWGISLLRRAA